MIHTCGGERKRAQPSNLREPVELLISAFSQGMINLSQSEADETDFNQIEANPTNLGIWEYSPFINYFYFLINKFDF